MTNLPDKELLRNFLYEFFKSIGVVWLIGKIPFLQYKDWVKERIEKETKETP